MRESARAGAKGSDFASRAVRITGATTPSTVPDEPVAESGPELLWHKSLKVQFNSYWSCRSRKPKPGRQAGDVGVDDDADVQAEGVT